MFLKSLKLDGFKSFAKSTTLEFHHGTSAIVGPNGSGKSNVAEAIAWVLGEQSVKNLRGKRGEDFIFNGPSLIVKKSKASVLLSFGGLKKSDEILISRVVYKDGSNEYRLNDSRCKLKDINDFLSSEGIVTSKHHIVSQNEAEKILNTSPVERRKIIEDALGLKIYQFKKEESERKLKKAEENMAQIEALRREVKPHLNFLKKQFDKAQRLIGFKKQLKEACFLYFSQIYAQFEKENKKINIQKKSEEKEIFKIEEEIRGKRVCLKDFEQKRKELQKIREKIIFFEREIGRHEGLLSQKEEVLFVSAKKIKSFVKFIEEKIDIVLEEKNILEIRKILNEVKEKILQIFEKDDGIRAKETKDKIKKLLAGLEVVQKEDFELRKDGENLRKTEMDLYRTERELDDKKRAVNNLNEELSIAKMKKDEVAKNKVEIETILGEKVEIKNILELGKAVASVFGWQEKKWREIERIRIKIEEGSSVGAEMIREYEEVKSRDEFLSSQILDLQETINSLKKPISQLRKKLDTDFKDGILKISEKFQEFFVLMFDGGDAAIKLQTEGVILEVKLPRKGNYSLNMLSGGEKALTSIALLFAMSQVNPPPFLILDETDAALDESNSRKYAKMLKSLSENTQLILVTHNRETMNVADVLYGVTMDNHSVSRVLSAKLEEMEDSID